MGKSMQSRIWVGGNGCMWGVLHLLNYQKWGQIKKRLLYKKGGTGSSKLASMFSTGVDHLEDNSNELRINTVKHCDFENEDVMVETSKGSATSRLKALISDEISKIKGRHHHTFSCPVQLQLTRTHSDHHFEPSNENDPAKLYEESSKVSVDDTPSSTPPLMDSTQFNDKKVEESSETLHTQEMLDALDMVNTNKDLILEILETSGSSLVHHLHNDQAVNTKPRYAKTVSFPSTDHSDKMGFHQESKSEEIKCKEYFRSKSTPTIPVEYMGDGIKASNNNQIRKTGHKQMVMKRFKDLRHKIKHAIKESKHEKHRIAMDAVLHKVPHRHGFSKDLRKDIFDQTRDSPRSSYESDPSSLPSTTKSEMRIASRTSSFSESLDRYCQLYECSFNREGKHSSAETSRLKSENESISKLGGSKSMRRIFSLPNIKYTEACSDDSVANGIEDHDLKFDLDCGLKDLDEESISNDEGWKGQKQESISDGNVAEITQKMEFEKEEDLEELGADTSEPIQTKEDKNELSFNSLHEKSLQSQVKAKDKVEFDYVRYILDISGLIKNKPLGNWHSEDQPLDRAMLKEVEENMFFDTKCSGNEEGGSCYQMLLFDLINEVLMEIYAKSYAYYPKALTAQSKISLMPVGKEVLEEVWDEVGWYLESSSESEDHRWLDYAVSRDLGKSNGWMNIQNEAECVGLELEDLIFDHLLEEIICSQAPSFI